MTMDANAMADALGVAIKARDADAIAALYAEDIGVWHGATGKVQNKAENVGLLRAVFAVTSEIGYHNIRRHQIEGGVVQQHQLKGRFADGVEMPVLEIAIFIWSRGGKIVRIDEYFDSAQFGELGRRLEALASA